jgi:hypothetical protein
MVLRSDEIANEAEIERDQKFRNNVGKGIATASTLVGAGMSAGLGNKIAPFLSKYIPADLAIKGISKVSPSTGDFLKRGQKMGLNVEEGLSFLKEKLSSSEKQQQAKENRNIIEQYSPELHQFIEGEIKNGRNALQAGAIAQQDKKYMSAIDKITKDHKTPWSSILEMVYGGNQSSQPQMNQNQSTGQGQQALMDILNKINQRLGQ